MKHFYYLILSFFIFQSCTTVEPGERGIKVIWGKADNTLMYEGFYFYNPISTDIVKLSVREERISEDNSTFSYDIQEVNIKYSLNIYPRDSKLIDIFVHFGKGYKDKIITPISYGIIKEIIGKYSAVEIINKRNEITDKIQEKLKNELDKKDIILNGFEITDVEFRAEFKKSVEDKVIAIQKAEEAKNNTIRIKEEASQKVISAEAEAKALLIKSRAISVNKNLIEYEAIKKWDGKLPQVVGNNTPFINIK